MLRPFPFTITGIALDVRVVANSEQDALAKLRALLMPGTDVDVEVASRVELLTIYSDQSAAHRIVRTDLGENAGLLRSVRPIGRTRT